MMQKGIVGIKIIYRKVRENKYVSITDSPQQASILITCALFYSVDQSLVWLSMISIIVSEVPNETYCDESVENLFLMTYFYLF